MFYKCVCWQRAGKKKKKIDMLSAVRVLRIWLCADLSPKLNFHSSLLSPLPAAHCQALLFSHGRLLREHAHICGFWGWQQSVLRLYSFFHSNLTQYPN